MHLLILNKCHRVIMTNSIFKTAALISNVYIHKIHHIHCLKVNIYMLQAFSKFRHFVK